MRSPAPYIVDAGKFWTQFGHQQAVVGVDASTTIGSDAKNILKVPSVNHNTVRFAISSSVMIFRSKDFFGNYIRHSFLYSMRDIFDSVSKECTWDFSWECVQELLRVFFPGVHKGGPPEISFGISFQIFFSEFLQSISLVIISGKFFTFPTGIPPEFPSKIPSLTYPKIPSGSLAGISSGIL